MGYTRRRCFGIMAATQRFLLVCSLVAAVLMASARMTDGYKITLSNFKIHNLDPEEYQVGGDTDVTFSATLSVEGTTPDNFDIVFVVLSLNGNQNIGRTDISLGPGDLVAGQNLKIQKTVSVSVERAACEGNASESQKLCAGVPLEGMPNDLATEAIDCLEFGKDINESGAGKINCDILAYVIAVPVVMGFLFLVLLVFLCWKCRKIRSRRDQPDGQPQTDILSRPRKSLAHIYEDVSQRLSNIHLPFRRRQGEDDAEKYYEDRVLYSGTPNGGFETQNETNSGTEIKITIHGNGSETADSTPQLTHEDRFLKRPSQPNVYTMEDPSLMDKLSPRWFEQPSQDKRVFLDGISTGETADDSVDEPDDGGCSTTLPGPQSEYAIAAYAETPAVKPMLVPLKTGDEDMKGPDTLRDRAPSVDMPLHNAPSIPSNSDSESEPPVPDLKSHPGGTSDFPAIPTGPTRLDPAEDQIESFYELDDGGYSTKLPNSKYAIAADADIPAIKPMLVPLKTGDEDMKGPDTQRDRAPSVDMPLRAAPSIPSDLDFAEDQNDSFYELDDGGYSTTLPGPNSKYAVAAEAEIPAVKPMIVSLKTGDEGPDTLQDRAPVLGMSLRSPPAVPPDSEPQPKQPSPDLIPHPEEVKESTVADQTDSDPDFDPEMDSPYVPPKSSKKPRRHPGVHNNPDPESRKSIDSSGRNPSDTHSNPVPDPDHISNSVSDDGKPELPPRRSSKVPSVDPDPDSNIDSPYVPPKSTKKPRRHPGVHNNPDPDSARKSTNISQSIRGVSLSNSVPDPVSINGGQDMRTPGDLPQSPKSPVAEDGQEKPMLPPKPRRLSEKDVCGPEKPKLAPRPELPQKPKRTNKSDPGIPSEVTSVEDWSSKSTSSTSKPPRSQKPLPLSLYKPTRDSGDKISHYPSVTPKLSSRAPSLKKTPVDHVAMRKAIDSVRRSTSTAPNREELDIPHDLAQHAATSPSSPSDQDFTLMAVLEVYLALVEETANGEDEYNAALQREIDLVEVDEGPKVEPRVLMRKKSIRNQLTLKREKRKTIKSVGVYANLWNKRWEMDRANLEVDRQRPLGEGQFGKVYKALAYGVRGRGGPTLVAVKELKDGAGMEEKDEFLKELAILSILSLETHPHVVELFGCCIRDEPICIVTEYLAGGSLLGFLRSKNPRQLSKDVVKHYLAKFGLHVARGMSYVSKMEIVHRDLAARNILVSEVGVCKVSDFGFARDICQVDCYPRAPEKAPIRWYAPESIQDSLFRTESDVWSFGILLFEIATLGRTAPYQGYSNEEVRLKVSTGSHPKRPPNCDNKLFEIMLKCWQKSPDNRPSFMELVDIFEDVQDLYPDPTEVPDEELPVNDEDEEETL